MKKLIVLIFTIVFLSISSSAFAGKDSGLYIGGSLGYSSLDLAISAYEEEGVNFDDDDMGWKIYAGYNFGLIPALDLAVEGSYVDLGEASLSYLDESVGLGVTAYDLFGVACFNVGPVGIFGKVGNVWWDGKVSSPMGTYSDSSNDMAYGVGLKVQFGSLAVRAEYERFEVDVADVDFVSAGVTWTF